MPSTSDLLTSLSDDELRELAFRLLRNLRIPRMPDGNSDRSKPWLWQGACDDNGYGKISVKGVKVRAHQVAFYLLHHPKQLPPVVRHRDPIPTDCNPYRLLPGTQADNMADRDRQGRTARGSRNGAAVLDEDTVALIKADLAAGMSIREVARKHGSTPGAVGAIKQDRTWKHVPWPSDERAV